MSLKQTKVEKALNPVRQLERVLTYLDQPAKEPRTLADMHVTGQQLASRRKTDQMKTYVRSWKKSSSCTASTRTINFAYSPSARHLMF